MENTPVAGPQNQPTLDLLKQDLQTAVELEFSTIPPYLVAMYSIKPGTNGEAYALIRSVVMEEMLHMVLAANVLSAIGGSLKLDEENLPKYPLELNFRPNNGEPRTIEVQLAKLSKESLKVFMDIEMPSYIKQRKLLGFQAINIPERTVGEFYGSIKSKLITLSASENIFDNPANTQVTPQYYWGSGGEAIVVKDLDTALKAIDMIVEQGEGTSKKPTTFGDVLTNNEIPHYFRFSALHAGHHYKPEDELDKPKGDVLSISTDDIYPLKPNCARSDFDGSPELIHLNSLFNINYSTMLSQIAEGFNGNPAAFYPAIINCMKNLTSIAQNMVQIPLPKQPKLHAAPLFQWETVGKKQAPDN